MPRTFMARLGMTAILLGRLTAAATEVPNILWITAEDIGPQLGCYGDTYAETPHLDRFAAKSLRYRNAWSTAPVCAPARTAIITGVYPTATGSEHMRSEVAMPAFMRMYPELLRERGYFCSNNSKEDFNLRPNSQVWDENSGTAHWRNRNPGQPFFSVFNLNVTHESRVRARPHTPIHDPARAPLPAYHPDTPEVRRDWAQYHDNITTMDAQAGKLLKELEDAGLMESTIIFFYGDHGAGMPRSKRWPYNSGLHVPLLVYVPEKFKDLAPKDYVPGGVSGRLVGFVDLAPTLFSVAGIPKPDWIQGHAFMGAFDEPARAYLHGFRGRMDECQDLVRSVRNERYVYTRNYMPHLVYGQHLAYMFQTPTTRVWKQLHDEGRLRPPQTYFWETKPSEELYDLETDPDEVSNLAGSAEHQTILAELRRAQRDHALATRDFGFLPEAEQHTRSIGSTMYETAQDPRQYPLERILDMAELASGRHSEPLSRLKEGLKDPDSGVRYWAAMGLLIRGRPAVTDSRNELRASLRDTSPNVRIIAAQALGEHGSAADLARALSVLNNLAPPDKNGTYVSLAALSAVYALGEKAHPLRATLETMPRTDPNGVERTSEYVPRLLDKILKNESTTTPRKHAPSGTNR